MKIKSKLKNINKYIIIILIGFLITSTIIGVSAATILEASEVSYTNNDQSTVEGALDDLYSKTKLNKDVIKYVMLDYSDPDCGAFKTDPSSTTWVDILKNKGLQTCTMTYDLDKSYENVKFMYIQFSTTSTKAHKIHYTGGTHYYDFLDVFLDEINNDSNVIRKPNIFYPIIFTTKDTDSTNPFITAYVGDVGDKKLIINFYRASNSSTASEGFQIRGEPMIQYAEIYYE